MPEIPSPRLSVIIPVFDRAAQLRACLRSLAADNSLREFEVIVVCDGGPQAAMEAAARETWNASDIPIHYLQMPRQGGPARARNAAVRQARGEVILFLNDDVRLEPGFLAAHYAAHSARPGHAVIGNTRWAPEAVASDFMHWVAHHDSFYYLLEDHQTVTWEYFHTLNASIHRRWFDDGHLFDEAFPDPAFEDSEYAYRLMARHGLQLAFAPDAVAYHDHHFEPDHYLAKSVMRGRSARRLTERFPELRERIIGEYEHAAARMRARLRWRQWFQRPDGPDEWHARFALAFLAGYEGRQPHRLALRCLK